MLVLQWHNTKFLRVSNIQLYKSFHLKTYFYRDLISFLWIFCLCRNGYRDKSWCCSFFSSTSPWLLCFLNFWHEKWKKKIWKKSDDKKKVTDDGTKKKPMTKKQNHRMNGFIFHYIKNSNKRGTNGLQKNCVVNYFLFLSLSQGNIV